MWAGKEARRSGTVSVVSDEKAYYMTLSSNVEGALRDTKVEDKQLLSGGGLPPLALFVCCG